MTHQIRTLADGEKITEPGFYRISLDVHHSQPCDGTSVTSGVLRGMWLKTPADVWAFHSLNPNRFTKRDTDALRRGRAMAAFVEGGLDLLLRDYAVLPADKPRRPSPQQITAYQEGRATEAGRHSVEFWRDVEDDPRQYITSAELDELVTMGTVLAADPAARAVMGGEPEVTMAWHDDESGLWVLSRPDTVSFSGVSTDYKRMSAEGQTFDARFVDRRIERHGYDMQMALADEAFERLTGERIGAAGIIAQMGEPPHHVILREIETEDLDIGRAINRLMRLRFAECLASGNWPGPGEHVGAFRRSAYQREQIEKLLGTNTGKDTE